MAVLYGGLSSEKEVSISTGKGMIDALRKKGYTVIPLLVGESIAVDLLREKPDVAMIGLHGKMGEDGCIQGLLECMGIPYTGSGVLASAVAMNKILTKKIVLSEGISTPSFTVYSVKEDPTGEQLRQLMKSLVYPLVVKAQAEGSTRGTAIVSSADQFHAGVEEALQYDDMVLFETFIDGPQITIPIVGNRTLPIIEIVPKSGFYDYHAKYTPGATDYIIPARINNETKVKAENSALQAFRLLQCRGYGRADFMVDKNGEPWFIEMNTLPGLTATSLVPASAKKAGIAFEDLVELILQSASLDHARLHAK